MTRPARLAGELRVSGGFAKDLTQALAFAKSSEASFLPGWMVSTNKRRHVRALPQPAIGRYSFC